MYIYVLTVLALHCYLGFHLVAVRGGSSLVVTRGLLLAVASLVEEHRLSGTRASVAVAPRL